MSLRAPLCRVAQTRAVPLATRARVRPVVSLEPTPLRRFTAATSLSRSLPSGWQNSKAVTYDELKPLSQQPSDVSPRSPLKLMAIAERIVHRTS